MNLDVIIPLTRPAFVDTVLRSFERAGCEDIRVLLVTNHFEPGRSYPFPVGVVRFHSDTDYYGLNGFSIGYGAGSWISRQDGWGEHFLWWDDDQLAPGGLFDSVRGKLREAPAVYGNYRFVDFRQHTPEELTHAPPSLGVSRENPPNQRHLWLSAFSGLAAFKTSFYWEMGGVDHIYDGGRGRFDQHLGKRIAEALGWGEKVFIHEPPFAWHPTTESRIPGLAPKTNGCTGEHELYKACHLHEDFHIPIWRCRRCHYYRVDDPARSALATEIPGVIMPFEPDRWDIQVRWY